MRLLDRVADLSAIIGKRNPRTIIIGGVFVSILLFLLVFVPLQKDISIKKEEWKKIETQLFSGREKLTIPSKSDKSEVDAKLLELRKKLPSVSPSSAILDELTKRAKELNIEFISITPQLERIPQGAPEMTTSKLKYKILPIEINMNATYRSFAEFISTLENLESTFATAGKYQIRKDEKIFPKLSIKLTVYTYILEGEVGKE